MAVPNGKRDYNQIEGGALKFPQSSNTGSLEVAAVEPVEHRHPAGGEDTRRWVLYLLLSFSANKALGSEGYPPQRPQRSPPGRLCSSFSSRVKNHNYVKHLSYSEVGRLSETSRLESNQRCPLHTLTFHPIRTHLS